MLRFPWAVVRMHETIGQASYSIVLGDMSEGANPRGLATKDICLWTANEYNRRVKDMSTRYLCVPLPLIVPPTSQLN